MGKERRREPRYPYRLPITLKAQGKAQETITEDVSYRGTFVVTDEPPPMRSLVQVRAKLPNSGELLETHAMNVFVLPRGNGGGRTPGVGLQFYAMGDAVKKQWNDFIDSVRRKISPPVPKTTERQFVRFALKLAVKPRNLDELHTLYTRDVSRGGMFLLAPRALSVGSELAVDVYHPESDEVFTLECIVRRTEPGPPLGIGVEFHKLNANGRQAFYEFVTSAIEELTGDDLIMIDDEDPALE